MNRVIADGVRTARDFRSVNLAVEGMPEDDTLVPNEGGSAGIPAGEGETGLLGNTDSIADQKGEASGTSAAAGSAGRGKREATVEPAVGERKPGKRGRRK